MGVQFLPHHPDALHELRQALEGVVLALYRNEDLIRAGQGVERQKIEGRWAIEEHPVVRLRVHVYDEDLVALLGEVGRQVDGGGALPHTALLVDYGDHGFHRKHVSTRPARLSSYTTPSGRFAGTPTLRGYLAGVSSSFSRITRHRSFFPSSSNLGTRMTP